MLNIGANGDMQDITIDEEEHVAETCFAKPVSDSEIRAKIDDSVPKSTKFKDKWAVNLFENWREQRNLRGWNSHGSKYPDLQTMQNCLDVMSDEELNHTLSSFVCEISAQHTSWHNRFNSAFFERERKASQIL